MTLPKKTTLFQAYRTYSQMTAFDQSFSSFASFWDLASLTPPKNQSSCLTGNLCRIHPQHRSPHKGLVPNRSHSGSQLAAELAIMDCVFLLLNRQCYYCVDWFLDFEQLKSVENHHFLTESVGLPPICPLLCHQGPVIPLNHQSERLRFHPHASHRICPTFQLNSLLEDHLQSLIFAWQAASFKWLESAIFDPVWFVTFSQEWTQSCIVCIYKEFSK